MRRYFLGVVGAVAVLSLAATSSALARAGDRTLDQTYPVATAVCAKAHVGTLGRRLEPQASAVIAACDTLENAFPPLVSTVDQAESTYLSTVSQQKALVAAACTRPVSNHQACIDARLTARSTDASAHATEIGAAATFRAAIEGNRSTFWSTLARLRGAATSSTSS